MSIKKDTLRFEGTPRELGSRVFEKLVLPAIREASAQMTQTQLAQLYAGFLGGCAGSMVADFGVATAAMVLELTREIIVNEGPGLIEQARVH